MKANNKNMIITIDTELSSNGEAVARELSELLNIPCYGEEILDKAAEISGISEKLMHRYDGRAVRAAYNLLADDHTPLHLPPAADFITAQVFACRWLASKGPCILVDRHASMALEGNEDCVSIFIHADFADRVTRYAQSKGVDKTSAEHALKKADRAYRSYYKGNNKGWGEADKYDIALNASDADTAHLAQTVLGFLETMTGAVQSGKNERKAV